MITNHFCCAFDASWSLYDTNLLFWRQSKVLLFAFPPSPSFCFLFIAFRKIRFLFVLINFQIFSYAILQLFNWFETYEFNESRAMCYDRKNDFCNFTSTFTFQRESAVFCLCCCFQKDRTFDFATYLGLFLSSKLSLFNSVLLLWLITSLISQLLVTQIKENWTFAFFHEIKVFLTSQFQDRFQALKLLIWMVCYDCVCPETWTEEQHMMQYVIYSLETIRI